MDKHNLTGIGLELEETTQQLTLKLYDNTIQEQKMDNATPFSQFNLLVKDYANLIGMLIQMGINLQEQSKIDFGIPIDQDNSKEVCL